MAPLVEKTIRRGEGWRGAGEWGEVTPSVAGPPLLPEAAAAPKARSHLYHSPCGVRKWEEVRVRSRGLELCVLGRGLVFEG